jgi:hypothetical protein
MRQSTKVALEILGGLILGCSVAYFIIDLSVQDRDAEAEWRNQQEHKLCPGIDRKPHLIWECRYIGEHDGICAVSNPTFRVGTGCARLTLQNQGGQEVELLDHLCLIDSIKPQATASIPWDDDVRVTHYGLMPNALCGDTSGEIPPCKVVGEPTVESWGRWMFPWQD